MHLPGTPRQSEETQSRVFVTALSFLSYGILIVASGLLGRILGAKEFGIYSTAVAVCMLITTGATLGLEKLALLELPIYFRTQDWKRARGYLFFSITVIAATSVVLGFIIYAAVWFMMNPNESDTYLHYLLVMVFFLPVITMFMFLLEVCTACEKFISSTLVYRVVVSGALLLGVVIWTRVTTSFSVKDAILIYGFTWVIGLVLMLALALKNLPPQLRVKGWFMEPRRWVTEGISFVIFSLVMSLFSSSPLLVLGLNIPEKSNSGVMSAVLQIGGLLLIVSTATTRLYAPKMSKLLADGDTQAQRKLLRQRGLRMLALSLVFMVVVVFFGQRILGLFGNDFECGAMALIMYSIANCVNLIFAFAPWYLQFREKHRLVLIVTIVCTALTITAMVFAPLPAVRDFERVTIWYSIGLCLMFVVFRVLVFLDLRRIA